MSTPLESATHPITDANVLDREAGLAALLGISISTWWVPELRITLITGLPWLAFISVCYLVWVKYKVKVQSNAALEGGNLDCTLLNVRCRAEALRYKGLRPKSSVAENIYVEQRHAQEIYG